MKIPSLLLLITALFVLAACTPSNNGLIFKLDTPFTLQAGETASLDGDSSVRIRFDTILADSRCPVGVECIWAGRVELAISFTQTAGAQTATLILGDPAGTNFTDRASFGEYTVQLRQVLPQPEADQPIPPGEYSAELLVRK